MERETSTKYVLSVSDVNVAIREFIKKRYSSDGKWVTSNIDHIVGTVEEPPGCPDSVRPTYTFQGTEVRVVTG